MQRIMSHKNPGAGRALTGHLASLPLWRALWLQAPRESGSLFPGLHAPGPGTVLVHTRSLDPYAPRSSLAYQAPPPSAQNQRRGEVSNRELFYEKPRTAASAAAAAASWFRMWGQERRNGQRVTVTGAGPGEFPVCWRCTLRH